MDKVKLSFWELFTYLLIGFGMILLVVFGISLETDIHSLLTKTKDYNTLIVFSIPFISLMLGMMLEPISNKIAKILEKTFILKPKINRGLKDILPIVNNYLPKNFPEKSRYRFCKAVVEQHCPSNNISVFLARFGFYRSTSTLSLLLLLYLAIFKDFTCFYISVELTLFVLVIIFLKRAQQFKDHMEYEAYYNFVAYREDLVFVSKN